MKDNPFISIIIPCRNEKAFIANCLDSITKQDFDKSRLEVLIADGDSQDGTLIILEEYRKQHPFIRILRNERKFTPFGLNLAIHQAKGDIIMRMDSHASYAPDYISKCVSHLQENGADNVGGVLKTVPLKDTLFAKSIAEVLMHPVGAGGYSFRVGDSRAKEVDTVFGGCYKKEVFDRVGLYNEDLLRSQDMEFNVRLKKAGGRIMFFPDVVSYYYPKAKLREFFVHNFHDGEWALYPLKFIKVPFSFRHYVPMIFVMLLFAMMVFSLPLFFTLLILYTIVLGCISIPMAWQKRNIGFLFSLPITFAARHIGYGLGSLWGMVRLII